MPRISEESEEQNALARQRAEEAGLADRITVITGTYEEAPFEDGAFDVAFSQDAFVHAFSKAKTFGEALRVTRPGGVFVFCDLMCGSGEGVSEEELATFAATNMVNDWLSPEENVKACEEAGWEECRAGWVSKGWPLTRCPWTGRPWMGRLWTVHGTSVDGDGSGRPQPWTGRPWTGRPRSGTAVDWASVDGFRGGGRLWTGWPWSGDVRGRAVDGTSVEGMAVEGTAGDGTAGDGEDAAVDGDSCQR